MAGQTEIPSKRNAFTRATTPDGNNDGLPTPAPSGKADTSRPKQLPTVTPRRFNRFFTPRSSLKKDVKVGASRQALRDITAGDSNRKPLGRRRSSKVEIMQVFEDENVGPESSSSRKRKRASPNTPDPTPELSSPLKRCRPQSAEESDSLSEGEAHSATTSPRRNGRSQGYGLEFNRPVARWRQIDMSGQRLLQECGSFGRANGRVHLSCGSEWQHETADFLTRPEDLNSCINFTGSAAKYALPFCATSCNTNSLVAIGDEEGGVRLLETDKSSKKGFSKAFLNLRAHGNAVLDLAFSPDDLLLATASGDQKSRIIDMMTQTAIFTMAGHTSSVKQVSFQSGSSNVLATSSRDGSVLVWDLRCRGGEGPVGGLKIALDGDGETTTTQVERYAGCVNAIKEAAVQTILRSSPIRDDPSRTEPQARRGEISVTTLVFLPPGREHLLLTGSEADASVKLWDLRTTHSRRRYGATPLSSTKQPQSHNYHRPFGLTSMTLSGDAARLYTLCRDNIVYAYSTSHLILGHAPELSLKAPSPRRPCGVEKPGLGPIYGFRHPKFHASTFYVRLALRPAADNKSELIAVGSSDECAVLFPTDERYLGRGQTSSKLRSYSSTLNPPTSARTAEFKSFFTGINEDIPVYQHGTPLVRGHSSEVTDMTWTHGGDLVTVGDDVSVRCWREGPDARDLRTGGETEGRRWRCGWAETPDDWDDDDD